MSPPLKRTPLHARHLADGARLVPFAGYDMPVQFPQGVLGEHRWTREHAGLFDVSHMGPFRLRPARAGTDVLEDQVRLAGIVERLTSADVTSLAPGRMRYAVLLNEAGGMLDDLMIARPRADEALLYLVVNGATKEKVLPLFEEAAGEAARVERLDDNALLAVQGPEAGAVVEDLLPGSGALRFMDIAAFSLGGGEVLVSRSGYTGEDGFELLVPAAEALEVYGRLTADPRVMPIGLGARDSLRLEAGLPLYGHDADEEVSPIEAGLAFAVSKRRLKAGTLRGGERLAAELGGALTRVRCGIRVLEGAPAREGAEILDAAGTVVGRVTSGGFSPTLGVPIAMGFAPPALTHPGSRIGVRVRGRVQPAEIVELPFVAHRYLRKT